MSLGLAAAILSATALYMIVGLIGSLTRPRPQNPTTEDDRCWFLGFYNNPDDPGLFVTNPIFQWHRQVNIGHPLGLALTIATLLMMIGLAIFGSLNS